MPSTVTFVADGAWHDFIVSANVATKVVVNPSGYTARMEITTDSVAANHCPPEAEDNQSRLDGETIRLSGCTAGAARIQLVKLSDPTVVITTYDITIGPEPGPGTISPLPSSVDIDADGTWHEFRLKASGRRIGQGQPYGNHPTD